MLSAICFNFDLSKILSSGNGLSSIFSKLYNVLHTFKDMFLDLTSVKFCCPAKNYNIPTDNCSS